MIDYKKYIQVLDIMESHECAETKLSSKDIASAICELFDTPKATCGCYEKTDCEEFDMSINDFQSCGCPKGVTCPGY